ncbi:hypothetical protein [Kitasatospora sp. NPDC002965]|uniref:hypothetical protein n=1 Tax=Kitasatospora sp. NPDC002965 TaxID=3154775 RepID=UPI0033ACDA39
MGWVERGVVGPARWVAVYEAYFLGHPATQQFFLHDTPEQAAHTVMKAYLQQVYPPPGGRARPPFANYTAGPEAATVGDHRPGPVPGKRRPEMEWWG